MQRFTAASLFQPSNFAAAIGPSKDGQEEEIPGHIFGTMMTIPHTQVARVIAVLGFDFVFVDGLHVANNAEKLVDIIQTINFTSEGKTCVVVRIPSPDSELLTYALDAGASAIVFPQIDTAAQASAAVQKVRYAYNGGERSISPVALLDGISNMAPPGWTAETIADRNIAIICQIESTLGVENVDAIATTPGINGLMLGAADLRATLDLPSRNPPGQGENPKFLAAVDKLVAASKKYNLPLMAPAFRMSPDATEYLRNFKILLTSVDILCMIKAQQQNLASTKEALSQGEEKNCVNDALRPNGDNHSEPQSQLSAAPMTNGHGHLEVEPSDAMGGVNEHRGTQKSTQSVNIMDNMHMEAANGHTSPFSDINGAHGILLRTY